MPRIRHITAAGVLAGATVLGGVGLAGATDTGTDAPDTSPVDLLSEATHEPSTGEADRPSAPRLQDQAAPQADVALEAARASSGEVPQRQPADDVEGAEDQTDLEDETETETETETKTDAPAPDNHGQHVSDTARNAPAGPGHGATVSEVARSNGQSDAEHAPSEAANTQS